MLFKKPVIFLTSDDIGKSGYLGENLKAMAKAIGKRPVNMDRFIAKEWDDPLNRLDDEIGPYPGCRERFFKEA